MSKFVGRRGELLTSRETTRGTATITNGLWTPYVSLTHDDKTETVVEEQSMGRIADSDSRHVVQQMGEGEIEAEFYDKALGLILTALAGAAPSSSAGPPYTHTYTLSNANQHAALSFLYQDPDTTKIFPLSVLSSLQMTVEQNATVKWTAGFMSKRSDGYAAQTANFTSLGAKFLHQHLRFKLASAVGGLAGATAISLKNLELNVNKNTVFDSVLGTVEPEDILNQQFTVEGTIELNKEDETYRNYMLDGTYRAMEIVLNGGTNSILTLQLPRVSFFEWEQDRTLNEIVKQTINFKGHYDAANALDIISTLTLVNLQTSY